MTAGGSTEKLKAFKSHEHGPRPSLESLRLFDPRVGHYGANRDRTGDLLLAKAVWGLVGGVGRAHMPIKQGVCVFVGDRGWRLFSAFA
jgi:hypothetical protein